MGRLQAEIVALIADVVYIFTYELRRRFEIGDNRVALTSVRKKKTRAWRPLKSRGPVAFACTMRLNFVKYVKKMRTYEYARCILRVYDTIVSQAVRKRGPLYKKHVYVRS